MEALVRPLNCYESIVLGRIAYQPNPNPECADNEQRQASNTLLQSPAEDQHRGRKNKQQANQTTVQAVLWDAHSIAFDNVALDSAV